MRCGGPRTVTEKEVRYQLPKFCSLLIRDSSSQGDGSHSARLGHSNDGLAANPPFVQVLRNLCCLPRACFP